ncbi:MAG: peptidylprolyl isomerase [Cellulomonadaceae bacterium]|jgi:peptidyl-prolyl cis-trans isomerase A (cyclophilin A)|nr:peptidylprolyl isomerase [Cellulomonadaceae bacterium]
MFATLHTSTGDIRIELLPTFAPKTVANFVGLATGTKEWTDPTTGEVTTAPLYDGTIFHRIIDNFMIQGGDPLGKGTGGPGYKFDDEIHPGQQFDGPYILAMANAGKRFNPLTGTVDGTNGSQFFITTAATPWLNGKHTIFGRVADDTSKAVVDKLGKVPTGANDRPVTPVTLNSVTIEE